MKPTADVDPKVPGTAAGTGGSGCEEFVRDLYRHHGTDLLCFAARLLNGDRHKAEDVLQEATLRAWRHYGTAATDSDAVRPWLFTVVRNLVIDHHRAGLIRPRETKSVLDVDVPVPDCVERVLDTQLVLDALHRLTPRQREILALTYYWGYGVAEVAELLGIPPGTVKSRTHYALRALKAAMGRRGRRR